ncbi:nucleoside triphosphate pyrophosphohydrolase [Metallibacterium sp.]|uniref:nucleoside triphosphate pyrophosphohydrolase n=2 Tax=Metallibacterium sp. TaxID=2940281 RepID=UPI0026367A1E|nr:nucleoside triphosphate pyrophosphohydrolase [Metallibacterium sp.]
MNDGPRYDTDALLAIMARLRDPQRGCPWDVQQDFDSIARYTLEEAYEVVDAIERRDFDDVCDELGDLLLQVVFHARMAEEAGHFAYADVVQAIADKLVRRHPHVFGDTRYRDAAEQMRAWEAIKAEERRARGDDAPDSVLDGVSRGHSEWQRALKLQELAATVGFDWPGPGPVLDKLDEEMAELRAEFSAGEAIPTDTARIEDELGDMLFVAVNLARHARIDPARALRRANAKFERRFRAMERIAREHGLDMAQLDLAAQDALWDAVKVEERGAR